MNTHSHTHDFPILIVAAVEQELTPLRRLHHRNDLEFLVSGMGRGRAHASVQQRLTKNKYRLVISAGFSGGTTSGFHVGDLVVASEIVDCLSGQVLRPTFDRREMPSVSCGRFLTLDRVVREPEMKKKMGIQYKTIAVDMESAAVGSAAQEAGIPWMAIRSILDPMEVRLRITSAWEAFQAVARPPQWGHLKKFMQDIRIAAESLAVGLNNSF